jgi:hypothetical protein
MCRERTFQKKRKQWCFEVELVRRIQGRSKAAKVLGLEGERRGS